MPYVNCPSCGERGKIPQALVGARIKCKRCSVSFQVSPPAAKATTAPGAAFSSAAGAPPDGIEVEGLDASTWSLSTEAGVALNAQATIEPEKEAGPSSAFIPAGPTPGAHEYKVLTAKDKCFDGKFDLTRLEEALNLFGRQGWTVKSMSTPHVKGFSGALEETIVVLLER
jgi:hypothetical protein